MKSISSKRGQQQGSVLFVTLFIACLFGIFLFSYLYLVQHQRALVARSQAWNAALSVAEAGIEEALAQLNPGAPQDTIDRTANGWGAASAGLYGPMTRSIGGGSYSVVFTTDTNPVLYCTGYVSVPSLSATLSRVVRVTTAKSALFSVAMAARDGIDLKGNGINTDSFNSALGTLSTDGYYDPSKTSTNGDLASFAGIVNVGNGNVNGSVLLGPTADDSISKNGYVSGGVENDFNVEFEDVVLPKTTWLPTIARILPMTIDGVKYDYVFDPTKALGLPSGDYSVSSLSGNVYVGPNIKVRLLVTTSSTVNIIRVGGTNSQAGNITLYVDAPSFTISGNETVDGGNAAALTYYGTTNNTEMSFTGNSSFIGTIYAPEADFKLGGGGNTPFDFIGASTSRTVNMNGHYNFHFDENLVAGPSKGFVAASWTEL